MIRIRLYVDEDASEWGVINGLVRAGIDVLTAQAAGKLRVSDDLQLRYATSSGRAIYSLNVSDYARLHAGFLRAGDNHAGIILIPRQQYGVGEKLRRLLALINSVEAEDVCNQILFI